MKKLLSVASVFALTTSLISAAPALAANDDGVCNLSGAGTQVSPWLITSQADLAEVGLGDCISTLNEDHHYRLANDITLTGNHSPIDLRTLNNGGASFDGNNKTISGLSISGQGMVGFFRLVERATVKNLKLTGSLVDGGTGAFVGALAADVRESTIQNVVVELSGDVRGGQLVGGLIGEATLSTLSNLSFTSSSGNVTGTSYCGGGIGGLVDSSISGLHVKTDTSFSNIGGGVIGSVVTNGLQFNEQLVLDQLYFEGNAKADQYSGGLIGYAYSTGQGLNLSITNSAVVGKVGARTLSYEPAAFIGYIGNGLQSVTFRNNFVKAQFERNLDSSRTTLNARPAMGGPNYTFTAGNLLTVSSNSSVLLPAYGTVADVTSPAALTAADWTFIQRTSIAPVDPGVKWVLKTGLNNGLPMTASAYNLGVYGAVSGTLCPPGTYSTDGTSASTCQVAPAGSYVAFYGMEAATPCPPGMFQANSQSTVCAPAPAGRYVSQPGQAAYETCLAGTFSASTGSTSCTDAPAGSFVADSGQNGPTQCPAGKFQSLVAQTSCEDAPLGSYVPSPGATAALLCPAGETTLAVGSISCSPIAAAGGASYDGPALSGSRISARAGERVVLTGTKLQGVTSVTIDGTPCAVLLASPSALTIALPENVGAGLKDVVLTSSIGTITVQGGIQIVKGGSNLQSKSGSVKRIGDRVRILFDSPVGLGKLQFKVNGKEIAWVNAVDSSDPKLKSNLNKSYFVRNRLLAQGKNVIEIFIDNIRVKRVAYTK